MDHMHFVIYALTQGDTKLLGQSVISGVCLWQTCATAWQGGYEASQKPRIR